MEDYLHCTPGTPVGTPVSALESHQRDATKGASIVLINDDPRAPGIFLIFGDTDIHSQFMQSRYIDVD